MVGGVGAGGQKPLATRLGIICLSAKQPGEPVSVAPVRAARTLLTFRVVLAFLMRAAEKPVGHDDRLDVMRLKELQHCLQQLRVLPCILVR